MKYIWLALGAFFLIISCVPDNKGVDTQKIYTDEEYRLKITGYWTEEGFSLAQSVFLSDGVYKEWVYDGPEKKSFKVEIEGHWWVENGYLFNELTKLIPKIKGFEIGDVAVDKIIDVSEDTLRLIDETGEAYKLIRNK